MIRVFISVPNGQIMLWEMIQGDKGFIMGNHFVKGFVVGFGLGVVFMLVAAVVCFS